MHVLVYVLGESFPASVTTAASIPIYFLVYKCVCLSHRHNDDTEKEKEKEKQREYVATN